MSYPIYFQVLHPPGIAASVAVNGVPFYRAVVDHHAAPAGPFNHMLVPGKNRIHVALTEVPSTVPEHVVLSFVFRVQRESDDSRIAEVRFPELVGELEEKRRAEVERQPRQLPVQFEREFELDFEPMEPVWWNAPKEGFGAEGNAEQRAAVAALHAAYAKSDVDAFLDATSVKMA